MVFCKNKLPFHFLSNYLGIPQIFFIKEFFVKFNILTFLSKNLKKFRYFDKRNIFCKNNPRLTHGYVLHDLCPSLIKDFPCCTLPYILPSETCANGLGGLNGLIEHARTSLMGSGVMRLDCNGGRTLIFFLRCFFCRITYCYNLKLFHWV